MKKQWCMRIGTFLVMAGLLLAWSLQALALQPFHVSQYCTDKAGVLTADQTREIAGLLHDFDQKTGNQLLIVTIPSLEGEDVTDFAQKLFEMNKPGQKGKDNGLVMLIAVQDHKMWISTGYGLEEALPDGRVGAIRDRMFPYFRNNDYYQGILTGTELLTQTISNYTGGGGTENRTPARRSSSMPLVWILFLVIAAFSYLGNWGQRRRFRRGYSEPWFWGGGGGFGGGSGFGGGGFGGGDSGGFSGGGGNFGGGGAGGSW